MGKKIRLIARLDVKDTNLVKGIQLEGLRKLGDPNRFAKEYYEQGIDELLYIDIVASLYNRNNLSDIVRRHHPASSPLRGVPAPQCQYPRRDWKAARPGRPRQ